MPGLIQAMSSPTVVTFQPSKRLRRDQHREVGLAARARESGRDVGLLALGRLDAEDQHVLGEPALVARHARCDAQREALLAEQRVAAVAGAERPDRRASSGKWTMYLCSGLHGQATSFWPGASGAPTECMHGTNSPSSPSTSSTALAHARHDPHVDDDVGRVGDLDADLRDRRAERAHAERHDVHRAAAHAAVERAPSSDAPSSRSGSIQLLVGPASSLLLRADERAVLDARDVARIASGPGSCSGRFSGLSRMNVPASTISSHSRSYSSCEPSHQ